jgi:hypothetical protein
MSYVLLGLLALAILASFVIAYVSARTWPIYQVVVVVMLFLATVAFFYLGARTLATHRSWRDLVQRQQQEIEQVHAQTIPLTGGTDAQGHRVSGKIPQLRNELETLAQARRGVYFDAIAESMKDGVVQLTLQPPKLPQPVDPNADPNAPAPPPEQPPAEQPGQPAEKAPFAHGLAANSVVFAFDSKPFAEGGRYLGEFKVTTAAEGSPAVQVQPNLPLTEAQMKRLQAAVKGTWTLYTTMPADDADVFAGLDDAARQALLPGETAAEYAKPDRELRDYHVFFHENHTQRMLLADSISKTQSNIERLNAATDEAKKEAAYRETEKTNLAGDLENFRREIEAIASYQQALEGQLAKVRAALRDTYIENRRAAAAIAIDQFQALEEINARAVANSP